MTTWYVAYTWMQYGERQEGYELTWQHPDEWIRSKQAKYPERGYSLVREERLSGSESMKWFVSYAWNPEAGLPQQLDYTLCDKNPLDLIVKWQAQWPERNYVLVFFAEVPRDVQP